jgi:hypothetical protein
VKRFGIRRVWREGPLGEERCEVVAETDLLSEALRFPALLGAAARGREARACTRYESYVSATGRALSVPEAV